MGEENQTNQTKPKIIQTEPYKKPHGLSYYCEVSLNAKFLPPRLYVSCISTQYSSFSGGEKNEEKKFGLNVFWLKFILAKIFFCKNSFRQYIFWQNFLSTILYLVKIFLCLQNFMTILFGESFYFFKKDYSWKIFGQWIFLANFFLAKCFFQQFHFQ